MKLTVPSFAKTNWTLEILGKRADGFHELLTLFQTLDLSDQLSFDISPRKITLATEGREVSDGTDNLVHIAAVLIKQRTGVDQGVHIELEKRIPVGSGLGGGSSNAAITLLSLNQLWNCHLSFEDLQRLAGEIGSDVPFFVSGGTGLGWGRGERVYPLPDLSREFYVLIYYPRFQVSAALAYSDLKMRPGKLTRPELDTTIRRFQEVLEAGNWNALRNDLEGPVFSRYPLLADRKRGLLAAGCEFGMLSGSGSALLGISSSDSLETAKERLAVADDADIILCRTLSRKLYIDRLKEAGIRLDRLRSEEASN